MIWAIIPAWLRRALIWAGTLIVAIGAAWFARGRSAKTAQKLDALEKEAQANGRINEADLGVGAADSSNVDWMREFATKHGKR